MIETIEHNGTRYPGFQAEGFAAKFAFPFALQVCRGEGLDVGCNRPEWAFPDAIYIDPIINDNYDALHLPVGKYDYIFSSHCLEHLNNWVDALDYWQTKIKSGGVLFLYLPSYENSYWRSWHNRKHVHNLSRQMMKDYLTDRGWNNIFVSGIDLNSSFMVMANK
jgi:SAM-dependent methyltransferase